MAEGFDRMDLSTTVHLDQKFRALHRAHPDLIAPAFMAYVVTLAESWREGERVPVQDAWPPMLPWDEKVVAALRENRLVDRENKVSRTTWDRWFGEVARRRDANRARWREYKSQQRHHVESAGTPAQRLQVESSPIRSVPSVPSVPSVITPPPPQAGVVEKPRRRRATATNPRSQGTSPRQVEERTNRELPQRLGDVLERARAFQADVDRLGAGKPKREPEGGTW